MVLCRDGFILRHDVQGKNAREERVSAINSYTGTDGQEEGVKFYQSTLTG